MKEEEICLKCIRWEGRVAADEPLWKARCSQIGEATEQTGFCIFWVKAFPQSNTVPSGGFQSRKLLTAPVA